MKNALEEILKKFVSFERRCVEISIFYFLLESKPLAAFSIEFLLESSLAVSFEFERILMH